ncbi:glycosyltransferase [Cytobacillus depressus]|uniref:Glycosyltransferase n=2 Tax=Cytobacillus depressus TaxID=1602942 RepID=A0A6L3UZI9_9BACI|nr:glycosyltransferase [Cytobacillus depressus]
MKRPTALILTAKYGSGHVQATSVLANNLRERNIEPIVSDLFGESYPAISTFTQSLLMKSFSTHSSFYKWFYYGTNKLNSNGLVQFSSYFGRKRLLELVFMHQPSFILLTFPLHAASSLKKKSRMSIPTYTVVTDYCLHPYWMNPFIHHYFVSTEAVKSCLLSHQVSEKRITVSGIPIRSQFETPADKQVIYEKFHLCPQRKVITILAGAFGVLKNVKELCELLIHFRTYQIVVICGKNDSLFSSLMPIAFLFPESFRLLGYIEDIHELFAISHCLITKPGGITLTEAAAMQVPLILHSPIPGQELENAAFFAENGAAFISHTTLEVVNHVQTILQNEEISNRMKSAQKYIYKRDSASVIIDHAINEMKQPAIKLV